MHVHPPSRLGGSCGHTLQQIVGAPFGTEWAILNAHQRRCDALGQRVDHGDLPGGRKGRGGQALAHQGAFRRLQAGKDGLVRRVAERVSVAQRNRDGDAHADGVRRCRDGLEFLHYARGIPGPRVMHHDRAAASERLSAKRDRRHQSRINRRDAGHRRQPELKRQIEGAQGVRPDRADMVMGVHQRRHQDRPCPGVVRRLGARGDPTRAPANRCRSGRRGQPFAELQQSAGRGGRSRHRITLIDAGRAPCAPAPKRTSKTRAIFLPVARRLVQPGFKPGPGRRPDHDLTAIRWTAGCRWCASGAPFASPQGAWTTRMSTGAARSGAEPALSGRPRQARRPLGNAPGLEAEGHARGRRGRRLAELAAHVRREVAAAVARQRRRCLADRSA